MADENELTNKLIALVEDLIAKEPHEVGGFQWAARPQAYYAEKLDVDAKTIRRRIAGPPFQRKRRLVQKVSTTLLRVGEAAPDDVNAVAKVLRGIWRNKTGMQTPADAKGEAKWNYIKQCLWGFAKDVIALPEVKAYADDPAEFTKEVFKHALNDWPATATAIKIAGQARKATNPAYKARFWDYPNVPVLLSFYKAVVHVYVTELQMSGKVPPGKLNASAALLEATDPFDGFPVETESISADDEMAKSDAVMAKVDPAKKPWKPKIKVEDFNKISVKAALKKAGFAG